MGGQGSQFPMPFWLQLVCTPQHYKVGLAFMQLESAQAALDVNGDLEHPLLDRITECSARPTEVMQFFTLLFWPVADERLVERRNGMFIFMKLLRVSRHQHPRRMHLHLKGCKCQVGSDACIFAAHCRLCCMSMFTQACVHPLHALASCYPPISMLFCTE